MSWNVKAQVIDKKSTESTKLLEYEIAPNNFVKGNQVKANKANLISEGFNGGAVPTGWSVVDVLGTAGDVTFVTTSVYPSGYNPTEGSHMARFNSYFAASGNNVVLRQTTSFATTGYINVKVNFDWLQDVAYSGNRDSVYVQWSTDGTTWNTVGGIGRYSTTAGWTAQSFTLPAGAYEQPTLYIGFLFVSKYGNDCHMDNIVVTADALVANDLAATSWVAPINGSDIDATDTIKIAVTNFGTANASNFNISYSVDGGTTFTTQNEAGTILAGATQNYTFATTANMGVYKTYNCVAAVDLTGDQNTSNDTLETTVTKSQHAIVDTCYTQLLPLWSGTVADGAITDSSYIRVVSGATGVPDTTGWIKFDITDIPDNAIVSGVELHTFINSDNYAYFNVMSIENDPVTATPTDLFNDTKNGNTYYTYNANFPSPAWFVGGLNASGVNDLMGNLTDNWFGVGLWEYETSANYYLEYDGWEETNKPYIVVSYTMPLANDIAVLAFTSPVSGYNPSNQVTIRIKNNGTTRATEIPVSFTYNSITYNEITPVGDTLDYGDEYLFTFTQTISIPTTGTYSITAFHTYTGDINAGNDLINHSFTKYEKFYPLAVNLNVQNISAAYGSVYKDGHYLLSTSNSNKIYMLDNGGTVIDTLPVTNISGGFRDLSADTNYIYAGVNTAVLYQDSIANDTAYTIHNYTTAIIVRGSEYDPLNNGIWISNWNPGSEDLYLVNKNTGATMQTIFNPNVGLYAFGGLAYDYWTPGGPYIVGVSQHNHGNQLVWIKISDGTVLVDHDVTQDIPEMIASTAAGGFSSDEAVPGSVILGGVSQSFRLYAFEIASTNFSTYTIPGQLSSTIDSTAKTIEVVFPYGAVLNNVAPSFTLSDYHNLAEAYNLGILQASGVNTFTLNDGDTIDYYVVRMNYDNTDSVYSDWKVIISMEDPYLTITPATQSVTDAAGTVDFTITSNVAWTAASDQTWCTVTSSGTGNGTLTADYDANSTASTRTATIIVTSSTLADTATLVQGGGPSGIENEELECLIYPNPSDGIYHLSIDGAYNVQVYNLVGEMIFSDKMYDSYILNLSHLTSGSYLLRLTSEEGTLNYKLMLN